MELIEGATEAASRWQHARNVLCIRLDTIGDVLMTGPAIRAVSEARPDRRITMLTSSAGAAAARLLPDIDAVIEYDAPWMKPAPDERPEQDVADELRARAFDGAVIFTVYSQSALPAAFLCRLAGIPQRLAHCRENPYGLLTDWVREMEPDQTIRHEVERQLALVAAVGCAPRDDRMKVRIPADAVDSAERLLTRCGVDRNRPWCVIHPGASAPSRRYAAAGFAAAADELVMRDGWQVVFAGGVADVELTRSIRRMMLAPTVSIAGELELTELAALISLAPILIANNSGPAHLASATGTPVVDLYALTNPQHTPWRVPAKVLSHDVPCAWCYASVCREGHHDCLRLVSPARVAAAARSLYAETVAPSPAIEVAI
ncbi:MAG TPA: lipopolysaccharide heptosyltransferase II [Dehalococcoidia bacterium]|nr:lipopolysaccharide heptosyltransferase II [Dehalococcoidia bacterium]